MKDNHGLTRRHLLLTGALVAGGIAVRLPKSVAKLLKSFNISEGIARAQDSVKDLKPFSLSRLKKADEHMDRKFFRDFWETKDGYFVSAKVDGRNNDYGIYVEVNGGTVSSTLEKGLTIRFPKNRSKPNGEQNRQLIDLQKLHDYFSNACNKKGCDKAEKIWIKVMFEVKERGMNIFVTFVDEKPRSNDYSDLKSGYPIAIASYDKIKNEASGTEDLVYFRIENGEKLARK